MEGFGDDLCRWRAARGLALAEVARRIGVARLTLWRWETGESLPNPKGLVRVLDALEVSPEERTRVLAEAAPRGARDELAHRAIGSPVHLGQALRALRLRARLTQGRVAERLGASQAAVAHWEAGTRVPEGETLDRLLAALGARPEDAVWTWSLVGREPLALGGPLDAKAWLDENRPQMHEPGDVRLLAFEREVWLRAARDPRWEVALAETMAWRANAHAYARDFEARDGAIRSALALAAPHGAWDAVVAATVHDLGARLKRGAISPREYDRLNEEAFGRARDENARLCLLHDWVGGVADFHLGRAEALLDRMRGIATRETSPRPQEVSWTDIWLLTARLRLRRGDPEAALEALEHARFFEGDVTYETLRTTARHLVESGRPTEAIVEKAYLAASSAYEREEWRGVAIDLGLPPPR